MRILAPATSLNENTDLGGGFFHVKNLQGLADRGVRCLIPLMFRTEYEPRPNWDVRIIPLRRAFKLGPVLPNIVFFFAVLWLRLVRREQVDLVRIGDLYHMGPGACLAARLLSLPTVGMIHHVDQDRRWENRLVGWTARRLDGLTVPSRATAQDVIRTFGVEESRIHLITEGATTFTGTAAGKAAAKRRFGLAGKQVVGFLGRLDPRKNVSLLLRAFAALIDKHPRAHLLVIGDGPEKEELERLARSLGLSERVTFAGRVSEADKADALRAMDVFAFPSLMEGFGLAVVEAMAAGAAVVASDRGSLPEVLRDGKTGLVAGINGPDEFAAAIGRLLADAKLRGRLAKTGRRDATTRFTWEACAEQTETAYQTVLAEAKKIRLGVLLNSGDSLATMRREGQESRFVDSYLPAYAGAFDEVEVFSYGPDRERVLPNAGFVPGKPGWKGLIYAALMPFLHFRRFRRLRLLRVMQTGAALPAVIARLVFGLRYVTTYGYRYGDFMRVRGRGLYGCWLDWLEKAALPLAERIIVTTPSLLAHVRSLVDEQKIVYLPNGVDLAAFKPAPQKSKAKKATVLFVGRLTAQKNLSLAIEALAPLADRVRLVAVGEGEKKEEWRALAARRGLELELPGVVEHSELPEWHRRADLFVLPSLIEGHPKALVEAMASGLPCVGTRAPGIVDVIADGENGLLAEPTAESLRASIERVLDDPALAQTLGRQARETAEQCYDLRKLLAQEIELLQSCAEGGGQCHGC